MSVNVVMPNTVSQGVEERPRTLLGRLIAFLRRPAREPRGGGESPDQAALARRLAGLGDSERERVVLDTVRVAAAETLGLPRAETVDPARLFTELGFDSLTAFDFRNRLSAVTGLRLPATLVFDYPTPAVVAAHLSALVGTDPAVARVFAEIDVLAQMLSAVTFDDSARVRASARLSDLRTTVIDSRPGRGASPNFASPNFASPNLASPDVSPDVDSPDLDSASDDEIFAFIGKELGIS